jgi:hypothetical protein
MSESTICPWCRKSVICHGTSSDPRSCLYFGTERFEDPFGDLSAFGLTIQEARGQKIPTWLNYNVVNQNAE